MIIVPGTFSNPDLPIDLDRKTAIIAEAGLGEWWQFDTQYALQEDGILSQLTGLKSGAVMLQDTAANRASLVEDAGIAGYDACVFDGSNDRYTSTYTPDFSTAGSLVVVGKTVNTGVAKGLVYQYGATNRTGIVRTSAGNISCVHRGGTGIGGNSTTVPHATWFLAISGITGTRLRAKVNSLPSPSDATASGDAASGGLIIGADRDTGTSPLNGSIADVMHWTIDLLDTANIDQLEMVYDYVRNTYGLAI